MGTRVGPCLEVNHQGVIYRVLAPEVLSSAARASGCAIDPLLSHAWAGGTALARGDRADGPWNSASFTGGATGQSRVPGQRSVCVRSLGERASRAVLPRSPRHTYAPVMPGAGIDRRALTAFALVRARMPAGRGDRI